MYHTLVLAPPLTSCVLRNRKAWVSQGNNNSNLKYLTTSKAILGSTKIADSLQPPSCLYLAHQTSTSTGAGPHEPRQFAAGFPETGIGKRKRIKLSQIYLLSLTTQFARIHTSSLINSEQQQNYGLLKRVQLLFIRNIVFYKKQYKQL